MNHTDKRYFLYRNVKDYLPYDTQELKSKNEILNFLETSKTPFENTNLPGHITGSSLIVDKTFTHTLLTLHSEINKWFQPGGHSDGNSNTILEAIREAIEESGLKNLTLFYPF